MTPLPGLPRDHLSHLYHSLWDDDCRAMRTWSKYWVPAMQIWNTSWFEDKLVDAAYGREHNYV